MQRANFYADEPALSSGIVPTKWIPDIYADGNLKPNIAEPYIMGYLPYDESPQTLFDLHTITIGNNLTAINFGTFKENRAWGYCWQNSTSSTARFGGQAYGIEAGNSLFVLLSNADRKIRFTNSIQYSQLFMVDTINIRVETICFATANIDENENAYNGSTYKGHMTTDYTIGRQNIHDFLNGTYTIADVRYKHPDSDDTYTTTLSYSDFDAENGIAKKVVDSNYTVYFIFNNVGGSLNGARYSYYTGSAWTNATVNLTPFILCSVDSTVGFPEQKILYTPLGFSSVGAQPRFTLINSKENFAPSPTYGATYHCIKYACTSWYGSLDTVNLSDFSKSSGIHYEMIRGKCFLYFSGSDGKTFEFIPIVKPIDIYRAYLLLNSVNTGASSQSSLTNPNPPNYSSIQTVALFKEDNTPKYEYEQGDTAQAATPAILQPWQMPNAYNYDNTFEPKDIPEYVPPAPTDEEQTDGSDWLPNRAFAVDSIDGFATMYGLTGQQLGRFGQYLWAAFWSEDFLNSIGVIFNENLSLNPSEILNYIVSVRCYPFNLSGRAGASSVPDTIYIGRGGEGIGLNSGSNILKLTSYTEDIDGGLSVWDEGNIIPAYYGDFRDYEPCSRVTVFVPFCGSLELPPSQVVGNRIHLRYSIDFSSGAMQATVSIEGKNNYIAGTLTGTIGATVELSASNLSQVVQKLGGFAGNAVKSIALLAIGSKASAAAETADDLTKATELMAKGGESAVSTLTSVTDMGAGSAASFGTTAGFSSFQVTTPMIRVEYRHYELPSNYAHVYGYACNKTVTLSTLKDKGFTVCKNIDLSGIPATQDELSAIESLLTSGVYF